MYRCCKTAVWNTWVLSGDLNDVDNGILHSVSHHMTRHITALQTFIRVQAWGSVTEDIHIPPRGLRNSWDPSGAKMLDR